MNTMLFAASVVALVFALLLGYWGIIRLITSLIYLSGYAETLQNSAHHRQMDAEAVMPVSLLLPHCDADDAIVQTIDSLTRLDYPEYEIIAVCDAHAQKALPRLKETFGLVPISQPVKRSVPMADVTRIYRSPMCPMLVVVEKPVPSRSDALNTGVNISRYPLLVTLSAGRRLRRDGLVNLARPFMLSYKVAAVGGLPRIDEEKKGLFANLQRAEYLRTFPAGLAVPGQNRLPVIPDAFGAFRKQTIIAEGGFAQNANETEMVVRLFKKRRGGKASYEIQLLAEPVFEAEPARGLGGLFGQRRRWQREMLASLWRNRTMVLNARYGRTGVLDLPSHWLFDVAGPVLEVLGCILVPAAYLLGAIGPSLFWAFWAAEILFGVVVSLAAVMSQQIMESERPQLGRLLRLVLAAIFNNLLYRQCIALFRVVAMLLPKPKEQAV